ncbi:c4.3 [Tranosema rostrale ichnovirus]|nr:c4.3 [Tranosema rostrale ichnovirus]
MSGAPSVAAIKNSCIKLSSLTTSACGYSASRIAHYIATRNHVQIWIPNDTIIVDSTVNYNHSDAAKPFFFVPRGTRHFPIRSRPCHKFIYCLTFLKMLLSILRIFKR